MATAPITPVPPTPLEENGHQQPYSPYDPSGSSLGSDVGSGAIRGQQYHDARSHSTMGSSNIASRASSPMQDYISADNNSGQGESTIDGLDAGVGRGGHREGVDVVTAPIAPVSPTPLEDDRHSRQESSLMLELFHSPSSSPPPESVHSEVFDQNSNLMPECIPGENMSARSETTVTDVVKHSLFNVLDRDLFKSFSAQLCDVGRALSDELNEVFLEHFEVLKRRERRTQNESKLIEFLKDHLNRV